MKRSYIWIIEDWVPVPSSAKGYWKGRLAGRATYTQISKDLEESKVRSRIRRYRREEPNSNGTYS